MPETSYYLVLSGINFDMSNSNSCGLLRLRCPARAPPSAVWVGPLSPADFTRCPDRVPDARADTVRMSFPKTRNIENTGRKHNTASIPAAGFEPAFPPKFVHSGRRNNQSDGGALTIRPHRLARHRRQHCIKLRHRGAHSVQTKHDCLGRDRLLVVGWKRRVVCDHGWFDSFLAAS